MNLIAKRPIYISGAWVQPGEAVPYDVPGFDYERADRKGQLDAPDGDDIVNPATTTDPAADANASADSQDSAQLEEILRANQSLKQDLDAMRQKVGELTKLVNDNRGEFIGLTEERDALQSKLDAALGERTKIEGEVATLTEERDAARKALAEGKVIPDDALSRLEGVSGIGKALAEKALAALAGK